MTIPDGTVPRSHWVGIGRVEPLPEGEACERMDGAALIAAERRRQIETEGWTPEHDDGHKRGELARAAACYALTDADVVMPSEQVNSARGIDENCYAYASRTPKLGPGQIRWPWDAEYYKRGDRIRELATAGALIAAEIDRLQRLRGTAGEDAPPLEGFAEDDDVPNFPLTIDELAVWQEHGSPSMNEMLFALAEFKCITTRLQECVQRHRLGLGGEHIDRLVCDEVDRLRELASTGRTDGTDVASMHTPEGAPADRNERGRRTLSS